MFPRRSLALRLRLVAVAAVCCLAVTTSTGAGDAHLASRTHARGGSCEAYAHFRAGVPIAGWRMGAIDFLSSKYGVGLTAARVSCYTPVARGGYEVSEQPAPAMLAVTQDGGLSWTASGRALPSAAKNPSTTEQLVVGSASDIWALTNAGRLFATSNGGERWVRQRLAGPVIELAPSGRSLFALACPKTHGFECRPALERTAMFGGGWTAVRIPALASDPEPLFVATSNGQLLLYAARYPDGGGRLLVSGDHGSRWTSEPDPSWEGRPCSVADATAAPGSAWLLCLGSAAAGSSTKALLRSTDLGRDWKIVSQVTSLTGRISHTAIGTAEPNALAAGSPRRLWLAGYNGLAESGDGGFVWGYSRAVNPEGSPAVFDSLDPAHAWLLAPGAGLWRTTDGRHWAAVGALNTGPA